jgi:hypothetical protein
VATRLFYDKVHNTTVIALHGLDKNGKPMRTESDTSSDSSNRVLDFEERLGVMKDATVLRIKRIKLAWEKLVIKLRWWMQPNHSKILSVNSGRLEHNTTSTNSLSPCLRELALSRCREF